VRDTRLKLDELLLARATGSLTSAETAELERLCAAHPDFDTDLYERAAAVVCLATLDTTEALPEGLRSKLERQAAAFLRHVPPARS
jgi:hypothetical protein